MQKRFLHGERGSAASGATHDMADRRCRNTDDPRSRRCNHIAAPRPGLSTAPQLTTFNRATALENRRAEIVDIEALARAAEAAADGLPAPTTDRQRLAFGRIQWLATKTSQQASASPMRRSPR